MSCRVLVLLFLIGSLSTAGPTALTVSPSPAARNLYRWQLLPGLLTQKPGDATEIYKKGSKVLREIEPDRQEFYKVSQEAEKLREGPLAEVDRKRVKEIVERYKKPLDLIAEAARCEQANWDFVTERLRKAGIGALLGEIQDVREIIPFLGLQARYYLLEDRPDEAVQVAATTLSLARQVNECPTLITHLVALAITHNACQILEDCVQHPKCPSLYGPLTDLPRPFITPRLGYEGERLACYATIPGLSKIVADPVGADLGPDYATKLVNLYRGLSDEPPPPADLQVLNRYFLGLTMEKKHAAAKEAMRAAGYDEKVIEKTPILNANLLHGLLQYEEALGRMAAAATLAYPQAQAQFDELRKKYPRRNQRGLSPDDAAFPLVRMLLPQGENILLGDLRLARRLEMLRVAEGLRQHAVQTGKWPDKLDVKVVPLPNDPATGKPFAFKREDNVAIIDAPKPKASARPADELSLRLTLRKPEEKNP
jgi:hypothetical protein